MDLLGHTVAVVGGARDSEPVLAWFSGEAVSSDVMRAGMRGLAHQLSGQAQLLRESRWERLHDVAMDETLAARMLFTASYRPMADTLRLSDVAGLDPVLRGVARGLSEAHDAAAAPTADYLLRAEVKEAMRGPAPNLMEVARMLRDAHPDAIPQELRPAAKLASGVASRADATHSIINPSAEPEFVSALGKAGIGVQP
jgi:hypothetical protein